MFNERKKISELKEHPTRKGFYQIPRFPLLYISEAQVIVDSRTDTELMSYVGYFDYLKVDVSGLANGPLIHKVMAETFLDAGGEDPRKYQVNHKNGDKLKNDIGNLEFITRSGNSVHAFKLGLRTDNRAVLCKDLRSGKVMRFYSMNECSRVVATNQGYLSNYLKGPRNKPLMGVYEVILEGDDWKGFDPSLIERHPVSHFIDIAAISQKDNSVTVYRTATATARALGIPEGKIRQAVKHGKKESIEGYVFLDLRDFLKDMPKATYVKADVVKMPRGRRPATPIVVRDDTTGESTRWISTGRFAEHHHVDKKTIQKSMNINRGRWCNYTITYDI